MPTRPRHRAPLAPRPNRLAAYAAAALLAGVAPRLYAQVRMAVVDVQRALLQTDQGRHARDKLQSLFKQRQEQLDHRQRELKQVRDDLEKQSKTLDQDTLRQRAGEYQQQFVKLQQDFLSYQQELAQQEAAATKQIYVNLQGVIQQLGQRENYTVIFDQAGVVWSPQQLDRTDQVVQMYNQQYPYREEAAPAAPSGGTAPATRPGPAPASNPRPASNPHPRGEEQPPAH